ncbi:MAG: Gfo/Idh/MocA family oxidoreductase [Clostridia bacterium]|nr:Gfo/Idh/MocA family oxidoreductase [Clostridia bacterium]
MLKIAIVGTGAIASNHIKAIEANDKLKLVALCDLNEERVKALAEQRGVPYFLNYKDIPEAVECDAVILNLPHGLHASASIYFLEAGLHVLVEKPMANTVEECDAMNEAAEKSGKKLAIAHVQRYMAVNRKIKEIIDSGELGRLCMYNEQRSINYFLPSRAPWFTSKKMAGGGIVMNYGAHAFDRLCYTASCSPVEVIGACDNFINDRDVEGHAQMMAKCDNGVSATITFSGYSTVDYIIYYYFTGGALRVVGTSTVEIKKEGERAWSPVAVDMSTDPFILELEDFRKFTNDEPTEIPDYAYSRRIIEAIQKGYGEI